MKGEELLLQVYDELRRLAAARLAHERLDHTLDATALVHEVYLKLARREDLETQTAFFRAAATAMQRILIDQARRKNAERRGGGAPTWSLSLADRIVIDDPATLIDLSDALDRLGLEDSTSADVARLRIFAGLSVNEVARTLELSRASAFREWAYARSWLLTALSIEGD